MKYKVIPIIIIVFQCIGILLYLIPVDHHAHNPLPYFGSILFGVWNLLLIGMCRMIIGKKQKGFIQILPVRLFWFSLILLMIKLIVNWKYYF
ncbi:hypothetical protein [Aquimarina algiphila]|uniref:hypothetical protein n=1 Tax=Aquimarina algiphila TaxID=2047982 RepID=UPI00232E8015|nr:hypothetical protein [Aquimarina algiphila]